MKLLSNVIMASGGKGDKSGKVNWPARDWRHQYGGPGSKPKPKGQAVQPSPRTRRGEADCQICSGVCCGVSRALIAKAFSLGCISISPKVS